MCGGLSGWQICACRDSRIACWGAELWWIILTDSCWPFWDSADSSSCSSQIAGKQERLICGISTRSQLMSAQALCFCRLHQARARDRLPPCCTTALSPGCPGVNADRQMRIGAWAVQPSEVWEGKILSQDRAVCLSACVFPCPVVQEGAGNGRSQGEHCAALVLLCANRAVAPQEPGSDVAGLVLSQNWWCWCVIWVLRYLATLASPACLRNRAASAVQPAQVWWSEGASCALSSLAMQAEVRKRHNILFLNVGPALFMAALFKIFLIAFNWILKRTCACSERTHTYKTKQKMTTGKTHNLLPVSWPEKQFCWSQTN